MVRSRGALQICAHFVNRVAGRLPGQNRRRFGRQNTGHHRHSRRQLKITTRVFFLPLVSSWAMRPDTLLIDFYHRVYRPLKLAGRRSEVQKCLTAIDRLGASVGRQATVLDLVRMDSPPPELAALHAYLIELGIHQSAARSKFVEVIHRGKLVLVPVGQPTPHEIEQRTEEIQAEWSEEERRGRTGKDRNAAITWSPPSCSRHDP